MATALAQSERRAGNDGSERKLETVKTAPLGKLTIDERIRRRAQCSAMTHQWQHSSKPASDDDLGYRRPIGVEYGAVCFVSTCSHCGTTRSKWIGRSGSHFPAVYRYPDGYERHGDDEAMSRDEWRRAWLIEALGDDA